MNRQQGGQQQLRNMSAFGAQPARGTSQIGAGRLPNGKGRSPGEATRNVTEAVQAGPQGAWPFGMQNGAPGLPPTSRTPLSGASFAQSLGASSQPSAPLDPSDFPSLTNNSSSAFANPSSREIWSTGRANVQAPPSNANNMNLLSSRIFGAPQDDGRSLLSQNEATQGVALDGRMRAGSSMDADPTLDRNPPAIEEFPPLGGLGSSDLGQDRRVNIMQNAANNGVSAARAKHQSHEDLLDNSSSPTGDSQNTPLDSIMQDGASSNRSGDANSTAGRTPGRDPLMDKYGLPELLRRVRSDDPSVQALAIGHDLTGLGLDLSSNEPLWPTWSGPFGTQPAARPMTPDFHLPACYKVNNVRPLQDKINNFNTETLFIIFYQMPGDVAQEYAAYELTHRNWRYHKVHRFWFTRLNTNPVPYPTPDGERGVYEIFNFPLMRRESRQLYIKWADVDDHITPSGAFEPMIN